MVMRRARVVEACPAIARVLVLVRAFSRSVSTGAGETRRDLERRPVWTYIMNGVITVVLGMALSVSVLR
jgi:hypothetical protein